MLHFLMLLGIKVVLYDVVPFDDVVFDTALFQ